MPSPRAPQNARDDRGRQERASECYVGLRRVWDVTMPAAGYGCRCVLHEHEIVRLKCRGVAEDDDVVNGLIRGVDTPEIGRAHV